MALLEILKFPDDRLRKKAAQVETVNDTIRNIINNMLETMYNAPGVGLAATQVNVQKRIIVIDISEDGNEPLALINPEIIFSEGIEESQEGCLSVPDINETITRAENVTIQALDQHGKRVELKATGLLAVCIQHEIDHLNGKLFIDYLSPLKRHRIRKKLEKVKKLQAQETIKNPPII